MGNPGATVSLVRKRPLGAAQVVFEAFGGGQAKVCAALLFLAGRQHRSKGVDAELSGSLATGWLAGAGCTYNINRADAPGALSSQTPRGKY